jgi:hypothetical protein
VAIGNSPKALSNDLRDQFTHHPSSAGWPMACDEAAGRYPVGRRERPGRSGRYKKIRRDDTTSWHPQASTFCLAWNKGHFR